jgi:hypothetical protein
MPCSLSPWRAEKSALLFRFVRRSVFQLPGAGSRYLRIVRLADEAIFRGQMLPGLLVVRHDFGRALKSANRIAMVPLRGISQPEMFPDRRVGRREPGAFAKMFDRGIGLACSLEEKAELRLDQKVVRRKMRRALQRRDRRRNLVQVDISVADRCHHVGAIWKELGGT